MDDLGQLREPRVLQAAPAEQRFEGTILSLMAEFHAGRVEGYRVDGELLWGSKDEVGLWVDEPLDEPRRCDPIHVRSRASHPPSPTERPRGNVWFTRRARRPRMKPHLDRLLVALDLLVPRGIEEIDLSDPVQLSGNPSHLLVPPRSAPA